MLHRFAVDEYQLLGEKGILHEDERVELLDGRIVDMTPIGIKHASVVNRLNNLLSEKLKGRAIVSVQNPIDLNEYSEPQLDITILKPRPDFYSEKHPKPQDVLLVIEIADASVEYDRSLKIPLYAKALIQEVWLVNLQEDTIEIYHSPSGDRYGVMVRLLFKQTVSPRGFPDLTLSVGEILGKDK
ncbi:MAG: Uma2 family endonuclease [Nitrospirae bacterium]|nr:Uma2 family endonuclease [Nitrospirota bacterium]